MSTRNKSKARIHISKPEPPPFLQRMKEQIVANEDAERRQQSERKRKNGPRKSDDLDDGPTIVRIGDEDLTEEEYKRLKLELDSQYRINADKAEVKIKELDIDTLIQKGTGIKPTTNQTGGKSRKSPESSKMENLSKPKSSADGRAKQLSYNLSSDDDE